MLSLKEGLNLSIEDILERCKWEPRFRIAVGLDLYSDNVPSRKTVFNFLNRCDQYKKDEQIDLHDQVFRALTSWQIKEFQIGSSTIRMDSKLMGTNIANMGRLEIVQDTLKKELGRMVAEKIPVPEGLYEEINKLLKTDADDYAYKHTREEVSERMRLLGRLIYRLIKVCHLHEEEDNLLVRVFKEQFRYRLDRLGKEPESKPKEEEGEDSKKKRTRAGRGKDKTDSSSDDEANSDKKEKPAETLLEDCLKEDNEFVNVEPRDSNEISAKSVQNPNDPDATYRRKNDQQVKGISANITETLSQYTDEEGNTHNISTIVGVDVQNASTTDDTYLVNGVENAEEVVGQKIETVHADGAYNTEENRKKMAEKDVEIISGTMSGSKSHFKISLDEGTEKLHVADERTGKEYDLPKRISRNGQRFWILEMTWKGKERRYRFEDHNLEVQAARDRQAGYDQEVLNRRNNVEASMFLISKGTHNNKTRYRGISRNKTALLGSAMWINFVRLRKSVPEQMG